MMLRARDLISLLVLSCVPRAFQLLGLSVTRVLAEVVGLAGQIIQGDFD